MSWVKNNAWSWLCTGLFAALMVVFFCAVVVSVGCEDGAYCAVNELACDEARVVICKDDSNGGTQWDTYEDCAQYEDDFFDFEYTCCTIDGDLGCKAKGLCELQAMACLQMPGEIERMQAWVDYQCQGVE